MQGLWDLSAPLGRSVLWDRSPSMQGRLVLSVLWDLLGLWDLSLLSDRQKDRSVPWGRSNPAR